MSLTLPIVFKIVGALGLILISVGILTKKRPYQDILYIIGGLCLEAYSIYLQDTIFITLQLIFVAAAIYDLVKYKREEHGGLWRRMMGFLRGDE